jgi:hypothetical protein
MAMPYASGSGAPPSTPVANPVESAIRRAADVTGVDFAFLMKTAKRESGMNPGAKARSSSAAGLFQFVDQTWLATLKRHGAKHGLGQYADMISKGADGRLRVSDAGARRAVLDLRFNSQAASVMAGELASDHAAYLRGRTGREPSAGELYIAHFLGPAGSAKLIEAAERRPGAAAATLFPDAASANKSIFYKGGRAATVSEVYANLTRSGGSSPATSVPAVIDPMITDDDQRNFALAARMDRLARERSLLGLFGGTGDDTLIGAQLLGAFGPEQENS